MHIKMKRISMIELKKMVRASFVKLAFDIVSINNKGRIFHSHHYLRHNARRFTILASLRIRVAGISVLEVGAGIGNHSHYYIDRGCSVMITKALSENFNYIKMRNPHKNLQFLDQENP